MRAILNKGVPILALFLAGCSSHWGILVLAHGGGEAWNALIHETVTPLEERFPVEVAFGMANPETIQTSLTMLEEQGATRIVVLPLFLSSSSFKGANHYILGFSDEPPPYSMHPLSQVKTEATLLWSPKNLIEDSRVGRILRERAQALSVDPSTESVLILSHGTGNEEENDAWLRAMRQHARLLARDGYREVRVDTLREDWEGPREAAEKRIRSFVEDASALGTAIVIPLRVAGFGPYTDVLEGLDYLSDGKGLAPHPLLTDWLLRTALGCFANCN
ncbi:hypothetical protein H8D30_04840 [bacterium]|nr:hypothetical protein [bacterium]